MGKHNKDKRKEYLKKRKRRLKDKRSEVQYYTEQNDCTEEDQITCSSGPEENNSVQYTEKSDCTEEDQSTCTSVPEENNSSIGDNGSDSGDCYRCLDLTDPKVMKMFAHPKPSEDPLYVSFYRYQRNKRKLLKLLRNPLQNA